MTAPAAVAGITKTFKAAAITTAAAETIRVAAVAEIIKVAVASVAAVAEIIRAATFKAAVAAGCHPTTTT